MAKYEEVFEDTQDLYTRLINEASLNHVNITILADNKAKEIYKLNKANALLKFRSGDDIIIVLNEKIFEKLTQEQQVIISEESLAGISYDGENDKIELKKPDFTAYTGILRKYNYETVDTLRESIISLYQAEKQAEDEAKNANTPKAKKQYS
jgi:hypothetical protein